MYKRQSERKVIKMSNRLYLAYGSNLNVAQMSMRCPTATVFGRAMLEDYRLAYKGSKTGSYLTIDKAPGCKVPVAVWSVTAHDEEALDRYEGFPTFYRKENIRIKVDRGRRGRKPVVDAFVYVMNGCEYGMPSDHYLNVCKVGCSEFGFDTRYIDEALRYTEHKMNKQINKRFTSWLEKAGGKK